jgi:hypothetical protein
MNGDANRVFDQRRIDALEELVFALAHSVAVEAPQIGRPLAYRLKLTAELSSASDETRRLFRSVARMLDPQ